MSELAKRNCQHIAPGTPALSEQQVAGHLRQLPGWVIENGQLSRTFSFQNYYETTAFLNATAWISHRQDHHPDIVLGYNKLTVRYSTHTVKGLSDNDFICAAKVELLAGI